MANTANGEQTFTVMAAAFAKTGGDRNDDHEDLADTRRAKTEKMTAKKVGLGKIQNGWRSYFLGLCKFT